jgi:hypothetical protein
MSFGAQQNITMIDDLPDLDDLENFNTQAYGVHPVGISRAPEQGLTQQQRDRFIRTPHRPPAGAGMNNMDNTAIVPNKFVQLPPPPRHENIEPYHTTSNINCIEIAEHIKHCPICSKFYNTDKTIFVVALVILAIVCILLLKRVLEL